MRPRVFRKEVGLHLEDSLVSDSNEQCCIMLGLIYIQASDKRIRLTVQVHNANQIGPGDSAEIAYWHPVFGEADRLARLEKRISFLIPKQPRLNFYVGAVVIGECLAPIETVSV